MHLHESNSSRHSSLQSDTSRVSLQGVGPTGFRRGLNRSKSVTSPSKSHKQASVRTVVLKPPEKGCLPGRARRATRIEPHTSTYSRDTEANVLNELFEGAVWHQVTCALQRSPSQDGYEIHFASAQAQSRATQGIHSLWSRASFGCTSQVPPLFTPLADRVQAQKKRRLQQDDCRDTSNRAEASGCQADHHPVDIRHTPNALSASACHAALPGPGLTIYSEPGSAKDEEPGAGAAVQTSAGARKMLSAAKALQIRALKDELQAAEGTVRELKRLIAEIENG